MWDLAACRKLLVQLDVDDLQARLRKPWRGQADKLRGVGQEVLSYFEEEGVKKAKFEDGVMVHQAVTRYWVKVDGKETALITERLLITRLFEKLLDSKNLSVDIKLDLCNKMNNAASRKSIPLHSHVICLTGM